MHTWLEAGRPVVLPPHVCTSLLRTTSGVMSCLRYVDVIFIIHCASMQRGPARRRIDHCHEGDPAQPLGAACSPCGRPSGVRSRAQPCVGGQQRIRARWQVRGSRV